MTPQADLERRGGDELARLRWGVAEIKRLRGEQGGLVRALLAKGFTVRSISQLSGIPRTTVHSWASARPSEEPVTVSPEKES